MHLLPLELKWQKVILKDLKKQLPCAVYLNGEYGTKDIYAGVPVIIGSNGVEKIIELEFSKKKKKILKNL